LHFFFLDIVIIFVVSIVLVLETGTRGVVAEAFVAAYALVVVTVRVLEIDAASGNYSDFFLYGRDRKVVGSA